MQCFLMLLATLLSLTATLVLAQAGYGVMEGIHGYLIPAGAILLLTLGRLYQLVSDLLHGGR